jgi:lysophospholipase L1-like esterase
VLIIELRAKKKILFYAVIVFAVNCIGCVHTADNKISESSNVSTWQGNVTANAKSTGSAETSKRTAYSLDDIMISFWETDKMINESVLMVSAGNDPPKTKLLFPAIKILSVKNAALNKTYKEGVDWVYANDTLSLLPGSAAPSLTMKQMYPTEKKEGWTFPKHGGGFVRFQEGHYFHDLQLAVTYTHKKGQWKGPVPKYADIELPKTLGKLKAGKPLKIVLYGDSITVGGNASGYTGALPGVPPFGELLAEYLRSVYVSSITTENSAVGGKTSSWGVANVHARVTLKKPDLVVLAFGMNDGTGKMNPDVFLKNIRAMIQDVKKVNPQAEFVLVAPTLANPETFFAGQQVNYGPKLKMLAGIGVQVIDMTAVHQELLKRKHFRDMTGNNINHPNDFLHRWYAQQLAGLLVDKDF